jgi:hypothetical protein
LEFHFHEGVGAMSGVQILMGATSSPQLVVSDHEFYVLLIGSIVPLGGYLSNASLEWLLGGSKAGTLVKNQTFKAGIQVVLTAIAGYLYTVLATDVHGFANISQGAFSAVVAALFAHNILWRPANVNVRLGAKPSPNQTPEPGVTAPAPGA